MSWRVLIVFLVLGVIASWQGGVQLGNWLVTRAPDSVASLADKDNRIIKLDALGRPITAQPPQPRIDGTLGVPRELNPIVWAIEAIMADDLETDPNKMNVDDDDDPEGKVSEGSETADSRRLAQSTAGRADRADGAPSQSTSFGSTQRPAAPPVPPGITVTVTTWQQSLKQEVEQCAKGGFFQRPTCLQNARNKYCAPNDAWGKVPDCPARQSEQLYGN